MGPGKVVYEATATSEVGVYMKVVEVTSCTSVTVEEVAADAGQDSDAATSDKFKCRQTGADLRRKSWQNNKCCFFVDFASQPCLFKIEYIVC